MKAFLTVSSLSEFAERISNCFIAFFVVCGRFWLSVQKIKITGIGHRIFTVVNLQNNKSIHLKIETYGY